mgnify:CR=1 FL=1
MNNKNNEIEKRNKDLESELKNKNNKINDIEKKNKVLENGFNKQLKYMNNKNKDLQNRNEDLENELNYMNNKNKDLENVNKNLENELKKNQKEIDNQKLLLQNKQKELNLLKDKLIELKKENENLKNNLENKTEINENLKDKINNLEIDLKNFKIENYTLESEFNNIKKKNNDLEKEMKNIKQKNNDLDKKLQEKSSKVEMLEIKNNKLEIEKMNKISDLEDDLKREKNKNINLNDELNSKKRELIEIRKEKNEIEDKLNERNEDFFSQTFSNFKRPSYTPYLRTYGDEKKLMNSSFSLYNNNICTMCGKDSQKLENENYSMKRTIQNLINKNNTLIQENENLKKRKLEIEQNKIMENKLSLIGRIIRKQVNETNNLSNLYNLSNKYLIIELIATNYIANEKVADVMFEVDRGNFTQNLPYLNRPISIGFNVTISAPHMHALALEWLSNFCVPYSYILDVGSGSGFLTLALSKMANDLATVVGVEHISDLYNFGMENVKKNNSHLINNQKIIFINGDGRNGYQIQRFNKAIYKAIHVGAASETVPQELLDQLACNGRMFIPIGKRGGDQFIYIVDKDNNGKVTYKRILQVNYGMLTDVYTQINGY